MSGLRFIILYFFAILSPIAWAGLPFCLESESGLKCWYLTEADCERAKQDHEYCIVNPKKMNVEDEENIYLNLPKFKDTFCFRPFCIKDFRELCNQEERRDDISPFCDPGY